MKIGIITPMAEEKKLLVNSINNAKEILIGHQTYITGTISDHEIVLTESGIGKVQSSIAAAVLATKFEVELIVNTGSAGALNKDLQIGDVVIGTELTYFDVDNRIFDYAYGQIPQQPERYHADIKLVSALEKIQANIKKGLIVSGDSFVHGAIKEQILEHFPNAMVADMESTSVAQAANNFQTPFIIIRSVSDLADGNADVSFEEFVVQAGKKSGQLLIELVEQLD